MSGSRDILTGDKAYGIILMLDKGTDPGHDTSNRTEIPDGDQGDGYETQARHCDYPGHEMLSGLPPPAVVPPRQWNFPIAILVRHSHARTPRPARKAGNIPTGTVQG